MLSLNNYKKILMILKFFSDKFLRIFCFPLIFLSLLMDINFQNSESLAEPIIIPADDNDLALYQGMGASYYCLAARAGVEFEKAIGVAAGTYANVLEGKHGGIIKSMGDTKLDKKQLFIGARDQIIIASMNFCPDDIPENITKQVNELLNKNKNSKKTKRSKK